MVLVSVEGKRQYMHAVQQHLSWWVTIEARTEGPLICIPGYHHLEI